MKRHVSGGGIVFIARARSGRVSVRAPSTQPCVSISDVLVTRAGDGGGVLV